VLEAIVAASPDYADKVGRNSGKWLFVKNSPVLISFSEVTSREVVLDYHYEGKEGSERPHENNECPKPLSVLEISLHEEWNEKEELHLTCKIPGPVHAIVTCIPWNNIIKESHVPQPMLRALIHVLVLEEKGAVTSEERHHSPEEE